MWVVRDSGGSRDEGGAVRNGYLWPERRNECWFCKYELRYILIGCFLRFYVSLETSYNLFFFPVTPVLLIEILSCPSMLKHIRKVKTVFIKALPF